MTQPRSISVVCAVIEDDIGRVLVAQRPAHKHLGLKWEFPGGKVEQGEAPAAALARELREELGCEIIEPHPLPAVSHDYGEIRIEMLPFVCRLSATSAPPHPHEHIAIRWVELSQLLDLDLAAADRPVVAALIARGENQMID